MGDMALAGGDAAVLAGSPADIAQLGDGLVAEGGLVHHRPPGAPPARPGPDRVIAGTLLLGDPGAGTMFAPLLVKA